MLKENFGEYDEKELKELKFEDSTLPTIFCSATESEKTHYVKKYLESITSVDKYRAMENFEDEQKDKEIDKDKATVSTSTTAIGKDEDKDKD